MNSLDVKIEINCDNAAFGDFPEQEVARILRELATNLENDGITKDGKFKLFDANGNRTGLFTAY
jgi:hypothetical protein